MVKALRGGEAQAEKKKKKEVAVKSITSQLSSV